MTNQYSDLTVLLHNSDTSEEHPCKKRKAEDEARPISKCKKIALELCTDSSEVPDHCSNNDDSNIGDASPNDLQYTANKSGIVLEDMPDEILLKIFSFLPHNLLFFSINQVSERFSKLALDKSLWKSMHITEENMDTMEATRILEEAPYITRIYFSNRKDTDKLLEALLNCKQVSGITDISLVNCQGSEAKKRVAARLIYKLLKACPILNIVNFEGTPFQSLLSYQHLGKHCNHFKMIRSTEASKKEVKKFLICSMNVFNSTLGMMNDEQVKMEAIVEAMDNDNVALIGGMTVTSTGGRVESQFQLMQSEIVEEDILLEVVPRN